MNKIDPASALTLGILATPDSSPSTLFGLYDVLSTVGLGWEQFVSGEEPSPVFDVKIVAEQGAPLQCGHATITPDESFASLDQVDILLVASFAMPGPILRKHHAEEFEWLRHLSRRGTVIATVCTAASLIAEAGLLDGLEATTYWAYQDLLRAQYPKIKWRMDKNICVDGPDDRIVTSGGATSWQEIALYLVARYCDAEAATRTAKFWVMPDRSVSQAAYSVHQCFKYHDDSLILECQHWLSRNYSETQPITAVLEQAGMASTTFNRRFKNATGKRPIEYVHMLRVEEAKLLLESTDINIDDVGHRVGYEDPASFRRIFKRIVRLTPSLYRTRFTHARFEAYLET